MYITVLGQGESGDCRERARGEFGMSGVMYYCTDIYTSYISNLVGNPSKAMRLCDCAIAFHLGCRAGCRARPGEGPRNSHARTRKFKMGYPKQGVSDSVRYRVSVGVHTFRITIIHFIKVFFFLVGGMLFRGGWVCMSARYWVSVCVRCSLAPCHFLLQPHDAELGCPMPPATAAGGFARRVLFAG